MKRALLFLLLSAPGAGLAQSPEAVSPAQAPMHSEFHVRYVSADSVYIDGGRDAGLTEGTKLILKQNAAIAGTDEKVLEPGVLAQLTVIAVASSSAVCQISASTREMVVGDTLSLPDEEIANQVAKNALGNTRMYPMVVSFNMGDPLDEEVRETIPHPPLPEINQARMRIGFDVSTIRGLGTDSWSSTMLGMVLRANVTRINGSYFNLDGFWRGHIQSTSGPAQD